MPSPAPSARAPSGPPSAAPASAPAPSGALPSESPLPFWPRLRPQGAGEWLAVAGLALALFAFGAFDVHTYDTGLYVAKGRYTLEHFEIPTPDRMLCSDKPTETSHTEKWVFQVIVALLDRIGGPTALACYGLASVAFTFFVLCLAGRAHAAAEADGGTRGVEPGWVIPAACALLGCLVGYERFTLRPELVTFPLAAVFLYVFERFEGRTSRWLWLLPALQVLWTNCHPLFPMGPLLAGLYAGDPLLRGLWGWWRDERWPAGVSRAALVQRVAVGFAVTGACLVNPHFIQGALYPFKFYRHIQDHAEVFSSHVTEFRGTFDYEIFPTTATTAFQIALVLTLAALALNARRTRPVDWGLFLIFAWLACALRRNLGVFAVILVPLLARHSSLLLATAAERLRGRFRDLPWLAPAAGGFLLLLTSIYFAVDLTTNRFYIAEREPRRFGFGLTTVSYPVAAVKYLDAAGLHGNAFTNWDAGSYLLWAAYPRSKPYISSEGDYAFALFDEYRQVLSGEIPFQTIADRYNIRYALIRYTIGDTERLIRSLANDAQWALAYADSVAVVFLRRTAENAAAIGEAEGKGPFREPDGRGASAFERAQPWFRLGLLHGMLGRAAEATRALRRATELYPGYAEAQNNLGVDLVNRAEATKEQAPEPSARDAVAAEEAFRAAIEANPKYFSPYSNLAALQVRMRGDYAAAEVTYRDALSRTVPSGWFQVLGGFFRSQRALTVRQYLLWNGLGTVLALQERFDEAMDAFQRSLDLEENALALEWMFKLHRDAFKDEERAQKYYTRLMELQAPQDSGHSGGH